MRSSYRHVERLGRGLVNRDVTCFAPLSPPTQPTAHHSLHSRTSRSHYHNTSHSPQDKRPTQPALFSASRLLKTHLSHPSSSPLLPAAIAAFTSAAIGVASANASSSPDDVTHTGSYGIGKPGSGGGGRRGGQPSIVTRQRVEGGEVGQAGEDAFFVSSNGRAWGVADGVGGWASVEGADSAAYSRTLMQYALAAANTSSTPTPAAPNDPSSTTSLPLRILQSAYTATSKHQIIGSTTACIVSYDPTTHKLHYANLGDSGFLLIRHNASLPHIRAKDNQHSFNCPYQLGSQSGDRPSDAVIASHDIHDSDVLVLATDGFFDNLHSEEIVAAVRAHGSAVGSVDALAQHLCAEAYKAASDGKRDTPFSQYCRRYGKRYSGGKMDDISVVVVQFSVKGEDGQGSVVDKIRSKL